MFTPDQRDHYDIESFYAAAEEVDLPFVTERFADSGMSGAGGGGDSVGGAAGGSSWSKTL